MNKPGEDLYLENNDELTIKTDEPDSAKETAEIKRIYQGSFYCFNCCLIIKSFSLKPTKYPPVNGKDTLAGDFIM